MFGGIPFAHFAGGMPGGMPGGHPGRRAASAEVCIPGMLSGP